MHEAYLGLSSLWHFSRIQYDVACILGLSAICPITVYHSVQLVLSLQVLVAFGTKPAQFVCASGQILGELSIL